MDRVMDCILMDSYGFHSYTNSHRLLIEFENSIDSFRRIQRDLLKIQLIDLFSLKLFESFKLNDPNSNEPKRNEEEKSDLS